MLRCGSCLSHSAVRLYERNYYAGKTSWESIGVICWGCGHLNLERVDRWAKELKPGSYRLEPYE